MNTAPFPLLWWKRKAMLGTRTACRKQLALADDISQLVWTEYFMDVADELVTYGVSNDGRPITAFLCTMTAVENGHRSGLARGVRLIPAQPRGWYEQNAGDIADLVDWLLCYRWHDTAFRMHAWLFNPPSSLEPPQALHNVHFPERWALAFANVSLLALWGESTCMGLTSSPMALALATSSAAHHWSPPPWNL